MPEENWPNWATLWIPALAKAGPESRDSSLKNRVFQNAIALMPGSLSPQGGWVWRRICPVSAEQEIRRRILDSGPITFAEFMEVALFWPDGGYYTGSDPIGASGDYYTSPLAHPAFGALLAVQLFQMWQLLGCPHPFTVVEQGAGSGQLCRDITVYAAHLPEGFRDALRYLCLDLRPVAHAVPSPQGDTGPSVAQVVASGVPLRGVTGCFLSNEFLDAFPVHRITRNEGELREIFVALEGGELVEIQDGPSTPALAARLESLGVELAEGQTVEINLGLEGWAEDLAAALDAGFVLSIDYGHRAEELYSAERRLRGSLTTFYRHVQTDSPLTRVGHQDMTSQVDFTSVVNAGRRAGLEPVGFTVQGQFLRNLGLGHFQRQLPILGLSPMEIQANRAGMVDLGRPGGLGNFKALVLGKNVGTPRLWGFQPRAEPTTPLPGLPVPLLTSQHLSLLSGRYPQQEISFELQDLWNLGDGLPEPGSR